MPPGLHLLAAGDVNDPGNRRLAFARDWLRQQSYHHSTDCVTALRELCGRTGNSEPPICLHGSHHGTVSSSLVVLRPQLARCVYLHAQGSPDKIPFEDYSHLLQTLNADALRQ